MIIYVNNNKRICAVHNTTDPTLIKLEIPDDTFDKNATEDLIKCYSCQIDDSGNYTIQLLVLPDMAEQINQSGLQHKADQETITKLQMAVADQYEQNIQLEESLTDTQLAITQLYEGGIV